MNHTDGSAGATGCTVTAGQNNELEARPSDSTAQPVPARTIGEWWSREGRELKASYAPWSGNIPREERGRMLRSMATLAFLLLGKDDPLWRTLRAGEMDAQAYLAAYDMVEALPALTRRKLLSTFAAVTWPKRDAS